jgi:regulator of protease activity HflC (stomatin/prohibitin superfamily)
VDAAFQESNRARQESEQVRIDALSYREKLLTDVGGPEAERILQQLRNENLSQKEQEELVARLAGQVQTVIAEARAYRMRVVEEAKANAEYLMALLPEYRKRPELILQQIYQNAVQEVLGNAEEKIMIQPSEDGQRREIRVLINRDPQAKRRSAEQQGTSSR